MTSKAWAKLHPIRWKRHQQAYRKRQGKHYHLKCKPKPNSIAQRKYWKKQIEQRAKYKLRYGCCRCGYKKCAAALQFHHKDPKQKIGRIFNIKSPERKKCILLCANCHFEEHELQKMIEKGDIV